jgi:hypothetical protein
VLKENSKEIQKCIDEGVTPVFGYPTVLYDEFGRNRLE